MRTIAHLVISLAALFLIASPARAERALADDQRHTILAEASAAYQNGIATLRTNRDLAREHFREAAARYQLLIDDGVENGQLHYDLGNALLQAGDLGGAILSYRRGEQYAPGDPRLRSNLAHARSLCRLRIEPSGGRALSEALLGWHDDWSLRSRGITFASAWILLWILVGAFVIVRRRWLVWAALLPAVVSAASGTSVAADTIFDGDARPGVVLRDDVIVRKGNGEGFEPQIEQALHEGVEFELIEERAGWYLIELADGKSGWIPSDAAGLV